MKEVNKGLWDNIQKRKNQYGFTLVEMIVAMTIMVIVASLSVFGLLKWQEWSDFKRQNEYAQTLFISAQSQLSEYENTQRIERFASSLQNTDGTLKRLLDVKNLTDGEGKVYEDDSVVWYESNGIASIMEASKYQGELCYVSCKRGDYEAYQQNGADGLSREAKERGADVVFALLESYVYDKNLLNASISVEFSPAEGQVFAVCYSDHGGEFVYGSPDFVAPEGQINIANREENYRREYMVGYYGTDTLAKATQDTSVKPKLVDVKLNNEETLNLSFRVAKPIGISQSLVYSIQIYDGDTDRLVLSFDIQGSKLRGYTDRRTISTPVTAYSYGAMGTAAPVSIGTYDIMAWIESDTTIRVVLDAADIEATTNQYLADAANLGKTGSDNEKFAGTYSFHRFGLSAENIYCTLQASGSIYRNSAKKQTQTEAAYFATAKLPGNGAAEQTFTYTLENARHLYNVRYAEDLSMADTAALSDKIDGSRPWNYKFVVSNTIDWNAFTQSGNFYKSDSTILTIPQNAVVNELSGEDGRNAIDTVLQADFPSIKQLRYGDSFSGSSNITSVEKSAKGQIQNLGISVESNIYYDIYEIQDSRVEDAFVGLFIQNSGTIANLALDRITVTGMDRVGAFCGENRGHLLGLTVKNTDMESVISGQTNVGGIMGYQVSVNDGVLTEGGVATSPVLKALVNRGRICGREYVGGIVGQIIIPADATKPQVTLTECENYGALVAVNSEAVAGGSNQIRKQTEPRYIGGIVGYCDNRYVNAAGQRDPSRLKVVSCISSPQYTPEDISNYLEMNNGNASGNIGNVLDEGYTGRNLKGIYVGGIVGYNNYALIEDCSTQAEKNKTGYVFGYQYVGGIVGFNQGPASGIQGGSSDKIGVNQAHVIGYQYVGGITGCNSNILYQANGVDAALDTNNVIQPDKETNYNVKVDNWLNEGIVFAKDSYAGGITGYNAGWIYNCNSRVRSSGNTGFFAEAYSGDYVGGIAGYNNGIIGNTDRVVSADGKTSTVKAGADTAKNIATICYISGDNYVGGIVGYNDVDATVENYQVVGGHILGNKNSGMYVGGFAGFNASVRMLMNEDGKARNITADPNEVTGRYFVGGTVGGNILNTRLVSSGGGSGMPTRPEEAAVTEDIENVYAGFTDWNGGVWQSGSVYHTSARINIYNNDSKVVSCWGATLDTTADMSALCSNYKYDEASRTIYWSNAWNCNIAPNSSISDYVLFTADTQEELEKLMEDLKDKKLPVTFFDNSANSAGRFWGNAASPEDCSVSLTSQWGNYVVNITNNTDVPFPNWRVELDIPDGMDTSAFWTDVKKEISNNTLILTSNDTYNAVVGANSTKSITLGGIGFRDDAARTAFEAQNIRLSFNNVVYNGNPEINYGDSGSGQTTISELSALFETDNFLGEMSGTAFVGGFVGYNAFVDDTRADAAVILEKAITTEFKKSEAQNEELVEKVRILDNIMATQGMTPSGCQMTIRGAGDDTETQNTLGVITAKIYVGGVLGYNDASTMLYVKNVKNTTPIIATEAIANAAEQQGRTTDYAGRSMEYRYSYAGGIIGKVGANVVIDHCWNTPSGTVTTEGTYTGGLCEINEGKIINCDVSTIGSTVTDYIGGLCGLNKQNGIISGCNFAGKTITARNVAGGIAAENFGQISAVTIENARVSVTGKNVTDGDIQEVDGVAATIAGYNGKTGVITLTNDIGSININSNGRYVGGITGFNVGAIWNQKADKTGSKLTISAESNIIGRENVGGFIGYNASTDKTAVVEYFANGATVTGLRGNAGGIIGNNASGNRIEYCENRGIITASNEGNAGGITAENASVIRNCADFARVSAPKGMCGGIAAINHEEAQIKECVVQSPVAGTRLVFDSLNTVGGISAKNAGNIENCKLNQVAVENYSTSGESDIGIVTGINEKTGTIIFAADSDAIKDSIAETYSDYSKVGGVAGTNYGRITGSLLNWKGLPTTVINATVRFKANAGKIASFGGVAGLNQGTIENLSVQGFIGHDEAKTQERLLGSGNTGYGGIVGFNGYKMGSVIESQAVIKNCTFDGTVWAHGSGAAIANIGGIAGANNYGGLITSCALGVRTDAQKETRIFSGNIPAERQFANATYTKDINNVVMVRNGSYIYKTSVDSLSYSYVGGMSGVNYGEILSCDNAAVSTATVCIEALAGFTGGVTGINYAGAKITGTESKHLSTGKNWKVIAYISENDIGTGGIIANNYSGKNMEYVDNYAQVKNQYHSNTNVGGMIGAQLQTESIAFTMSNCKNYGDVTSSLRAGGLICLNMFQGTTFLDCVNYGQIYSIDNSSSSAYVAGFVAIQTGMYSDMIFQNCYNHGNIIHGNGGNPRMAGLLAVSETNGEIFMENCLNTGLIRRYSDSRGTTLVDVNNDNTAGIVSRGGTVYINNCRNYNGANATGDIGIVSTGNGNSYITNCLDVSGNTRTGGGSSLVPLAKNASQSLSRVNYYISKTNQGTYVPAGDEKEDGVYFGITTSMPFRNNKQSDRMTDYFGELNPSTQRFIANSNGPQKLHLDVAYDGNSGMDAFVFYMGGWNRTYSYTVTVTDKNNNSAIVERNNVVTTSDTVMDTARQEINVAGLVEEGLLSSKQVVAIDINVTSCLTTDKKANTSINLFGFTWIPEGESEEVVCDSMQEYLCAKYKTSFRLNQTIAQKNIDKIIMDIPEFNFADYTYFDQSQDSFAQNRLVVHQAKANQWQEYEFEVEYADGATGVKDFLFYLTTENGQVNGKKEDYDYYYELKYQDGTTRTFGSADAPTSLKAVPYKTEIRLSVEDSEKQLKAIVVHLRCATKNRAYINMLGFKWIPIGETQPVLLCYDKKKSTVPQEALKELVVVETSDGYELHPAGTNVADAKITMSGNAPVGQYDLAKIFYTNVSRYDARYDEADAVIEDPRVRLYKELDPKFMNFVYQYNYIIDEKMYDPIGLSVSQGNGIYHFTWARQEEPYEYEVYYTLSDGDGNVKYTSEHSTVTQAYCKKKFDAGQMQEAWQATGEEGTYVATFYVRAVSAYHKLHEGEEDADKYDSAYVSISQNEKEVLPQPQFHIEEIEGNQKIIIIDNFEEFENYKTVCTIYVNINNTTYPILMDRGYSAPYSDKITANSDYMEYAYAKSNVNNAYITSAYTVYRGTLMGNTEYPATGMNANGAKFGHYQIGTTFNGFYGLAPDALSYQITYGANMRDFHTTAELVAQDENLGVPVAYASGTVHTANRVTNSTVNVSTTLTGFAGDLIGKDIEIRTYPYCSQNQLCLYGHEVANDVILRSREDVLAIQDANYFTKEGERITQSICVENEDGTLSLKPGYTIRDNQDAAGTYDVYFSSSLAQYVDEDTPFQVARISYKYADNESTGEALTDADGYNYYEVSSVPATAWDNQRMQPAPVIEKVGYPIIKEKDNHATYTFVWDKDKTGTLYKNAQYMLELFGRTRDGKLVFLKTVSSTGEKQYTFVDEQNNWNYKELVLQVSRIGTTDSDNKTVILPRTSEETFAIKLKLTTVAKPGVMLAMDKDTQHFDKNNLRYEVTWGSLTDPDELAELGGYLITAYTLEPKGAAGEPDVIAHKVCFYAPELTTLEDWQEAYTQGISIENEDILDSEEVPGEDYTTSGENKKAIIDLSSFAAGDNVYIRVQAVAKPDAVLFANADASDPAELEIQERLATPFVEGDGCSFTVTPAYDGNGAMSITELNENGMQFTLTNPNYTSDDNGQYEIAIAVYDEEGKALQDADLVAQENSVERMKKSSAWAEGAVEVLARKSSSNGTTMDGDSLDEATYTLKFSGNKKLTDYAGMWLKIAFRATTDNKISSFWTDEDPADAKSVNYQWVRIPRAQLDVPDMNIGTVTGEYHIEDTESDYEITRYTVSFTETDYAQGYSVMLTGIDSAKPVTWFYLQKNEDGSYEVFYASTEYVMDAAKIEGGSFADPYADLAVAQSLKDGDTIELQMYQTDYFIVRDDIITLVAKLTLKDGVFTMELPDVASLTDANGRTVVGANDSWNVTAGISVQAQMKDKSDYCYCDSKRIGSVFLNNGYTQPVIQQETEAPEIDESVFTVTYDEDSKEYRIIVNPAQNLAIQVLTADENNSVVAVEYVSIGQSAGQQKRIFRLKKEMDINGEVKTDLKYYVKFAEVTDDKGVGIWSQGYILTIENGRVVLNPMTREPDAYTRTLDESRAGISITKKTPVATPGNATPGNATPGNAIPDNATPGNATSGNAQS